MKDILQDIYNENSSFVENRNFAGVRKIIVDNYSDLAHFIFELLQNADDAKATEIEFKLLEDKLIITHNGVLFSEKDLRGICSISLGTKADDYTKIGRFGIGFKAVFVYTNTPQVFSGEDEFEIEDLILPKRIKCTVDKKKDDTVFVLPFNNPKTISKAYDQIEDKLSDISEDALLFLSNVSKITVVIDDRKRTVERIVLDEFVFREDSICEEIKIENDSDDYYAVNRYYRMKKSEIELMDTDEKGDLVKVENQSVMIAYPIDEYDDTLLGVSETYEKYDTFFVFFPTKINTYHEYMIHAPFVTKSSRETIALNNEANEQLMRNIGILAADSFIALASLKKLTMERIDILFFDNLDKNDQITKSFLTHLKQIVNDGENIIPCISGKCRNIECVLFTEEREEVYKKILKLFEKEWIADFYELNPSFELSAIHSLQDAFFGFLHEHCNAHSISVGYLVADIPPEEYENRDSKWFAEFLEMLVKPSRYCGYESVVMEDLRERPLVRLANHKHISCNEAKNIFLNNGSIDEEVLQNKASNYIYREIFKIKEYSLELKEAVTAIEEISKTGKNDDFESHIKTLKKIVVALNGGKIKIDEIKEKRLLYMCNQTSKEKKLVKASEASLGRWEKNNLNLYKLFENMNVDLIDERYYEYFTTGDLKKIGCIEGIKEYADRWKFIEESGAYGFSYIHPMKGKASNRGFNPYFQIRYVPELFEHGMNFDKSIELMRLVRIFNDQIKDWVEWSSRQDYSNSGSVYGTGSRYSSFGYTIIEHKWIYGKDGGLYKPTEITMEELHEDYNKIVNVELCKKLGFKEVLAEKIEEVNKKLESDGMFAISLEERAEYEEFKKEKEKKKLQAQKREQNRHSLHEAADTIDDMKFGSIEKEFEYDEYNSVPNKERREGKIQNEMKNSTQQKEDEFTLTKKKKFSIQEKVFLNSEYNGKCQICGKRIKTRENKNLFNATNLIDTSRLKKEFKNVENLGWNSLCLCPNCAAEYKYGVVSMNGFVNKAKEAIIENKSREPFHFEILMQGEKRILTYSPKHLHNLQIAMEFYDDGEEHDYIIPGD